MAGVAYKFPHKARYGHIHPGFTKAKTAEELKAVSLNVNASIKAVVVWHNGDGCFTGPTVDKEH